MTDEKSKNVIPFRQKPKNELTCGMRVKFIGPRNEYSNEELDLFDAAIDIKVLSLKEDTIAIEVIIYDEIEGELIGIISPDDLLASHFQENKREYTSAEKDSEFYKWTMQFLEEDSPLGDFARSAFDDPRFPTDIDTFEGLINFLNNVSVPGYEWTFKNIWREFETSCKRRKDEYLVGDPVLIGDTKGIVICKIDKDFYQVALEGSRPVEVHHSYIYSLLSL